ncbi:Uncharacterised protein [Sphingobacterium daejeonense]|nr:Uncharacterised protein [Sphingobacterium daejeonense]
MERNIMPKLKLFLVSLLTFAIFGCQKQNLSLSEERDSLQEIQQYFNLEK